MDGKLDEILDENWEGRGGGKREKGRRWGGDWQRLKEGDWEWRGRGDDGRMERREVGRNKGMQGGRED